MRIQQKKTNNTGIIKLSNKKVKKNLNRTLKKKNQKQIHLKIKL